MSVGHYKSNTPGNAIGRFGMLIKSLFYICIDNFYGNLGTSRE
jgi:hypothetical protein